MADEGDRFLSIIQAFEPTQEPPIVECIKLRADVNPVLGKSLRKDAAEGLPGPGGIAGVDGAAETTAPCQCPAQCRELAFAPVVEGAFTVTEVFIGPAGFGMAYEKQLLHGISSRGNLIIA